MLPDPVAAQETRCTGRVVSKPHAGSRGFGASLLRSRLVPTLLLLPPALRRHRGWTRTRCPRRWPGRGAAASAAPSASSSTDLMRTARCPRARRWPDSCGLMRTDTDRASCSPVAASCSPRGRRVVLAGGRRASLRLLLADTGRLRGVQDITDAAADLPNFFAHEIE